MIRREPYTWVALSPIKATDDMTDPVGQRDGRLFISTKGRLPAIEVGDNGKVLVVDADGNPVWSGRLLTDEQAIAELTTRTGNLETGKQNELFVKTARLEAGNWVNKSMTVAVDGINATDNIIVSPTAASYDTYAVNMVRCIAQTNNALTFYTDNVPEVDVDVVILVARPN